MNHITLYIYADEQKSGDWTIVTQLRFASMDNTWMLEGRIPEETDIVPWQEVRLPSGECLHIGAVFDDPAKSLALHVRGEDRAILVVQTKGHPCLQFVSPLGVDVSIQLHEDA